MSSGLVASDRGPGLLVAPETVIPDDATLAPYVTIHAGVELGAGVSLEQGAIVGRPQRVDARSRSPRMPPDQPTVVGAGCHVGCGAVVASGARVGAGTYVADHALVREIAVLGEEVMIGRGSSVGLGSVVGDRTRVQNNALVGPWTRIEEDVLVGPRVTFIGDPTMGRRPVDAPDSGIVVRRASRIGTAAIVFPPVEIGEEAVIGAASMVRADVPPRMVVAGSPAQALRAVRDDELLGEWTQ